MKKLLSCLFLVTVFLSFNYALAFSIDRDLKFLEDLSDEDLNPLVFIIKDENNDQLNEKEISNTKKYLNKIVENLEKCAINELDIKSVDSISYKQILEAVCKKQNIQFDNNILTKDLGIVFVRHAFIDTIDKMSKKQKESLVSVLREAMGEEDFENFLEKIGGTNGLLISSGETISNLLFDGNSGNFLIAICLASDITNATDIKQLKQSRETFISYTGVIPATTYIESLRIIKTQMPDNDDSKFLDMLIIVSIPVICVLLFLIYMETKKNTSFAKFTRFVLMCLFVAVVLLLAILAMEAANDYIVAVFIVCVVLISMLLNWLLSIPKKRITKHIKRKISKKSKNKKKMKTLDKQNIEDKNNGK